MKKIIRKLLNRLGYELIEYSSSKHARIRKLLDYHQIDLVLDVGANTGQYFKFLRTAGYYGRVVSFEPLSDAYSQLVKMSKKDPNWEIAARTAIGNLEGEISINIAGNSQSSSLLPMLDRHKETYPTSVYVGSETVKITKLDYIASHYISDNNRIFLKIDVQGYEQQVLEGAKSILSQVEEIQLEMSLVPFYEGELLLTEMLDYMKNLGYSLHYLDPVICDPNTGQMLQLDGIFFKS
jgi:FkbM family methyltransferase